MISLGDDFKDIDDVVRAYGDRSEAVVHDMINNARDGLERVFDHLYALYREQ